MFSNAFVLNEQSLAVIEQLGEHMPGGFFIYKAHGAEELLYANRAVWDIFGCDSLEQFKALTGFTFRGMVHPEDYERVSCDISYQVSESRHDLDYVEYRIVRRDGRVRWVDDYGHYVSSDVYGGLYYVFVSDITEKREAVEYGRALSGAVIKALTRHYDSLWLINDVETESFELFRIDEELAHLMPAEAARRMGRFSEAFAFYANLVHEQDRQTFLDAVSGEAIVERTRGRSLYSVPFRRIFEDGPRHYRIEFARLDMGSDRSPIVVGFRNVDDEVRREQQVQHSLDVRQAVIEALTRVYDSVWLINDVKTQSFELFRVDDDVVHLIPAGEAQRITRFSDAFAFYANLVLEQDRQRFLEATSPEAIVEGTRRSVIYGVPFRRVFGQAVRHYRVEFARLELDDGSSGIVCGFKDVDDEVRREQQVQHSLDVRQAVIEALTRVYDSLWLISDVESQSFELFRVDDDVVHLMPAGTAQRITRFSDAFAFYANLVLEQDRQRFLDQTTPEAIVEGTRRSVIYGVPFRRVFEDGPRHYRVEFARLELDDGSSGIVCGFKDVDDEVRREQQVQHSLDLRQAVIEALTRPYDSVWLINDVKTQSFELFRIDEDMVHVLPANEAVKITRFTDAFAFYARLVHEQDRERFLAAVEPEAIVEGTRERLIYAVPFRRVFEQGERHYNVEFARMEMGDGTFGIVCGFKDVDDEVRHERQVQQALREAVDAAEASSKAKSDFLSSMSHDIRTPMNGIIGMTTIAQANLDDRERVADCLRKISESSDHLLSLINEFLDMNKIESGKMELVEEEFNLAELIDGTLAMTRPQIQARGHSFRVSIVSVDHEQVIGDARRIQQVFVNIMSNAIKYTPDGGKISLTVNESPTRVADFGHYTFVFEDNGYGMTEEFQKRLFEPFTRANDKLTAGIQGTGLGMTITRNIVRMMGGDIQVESVYGQGSKFTVSLYLRLQSTPAFDFQNLRDLRVLVADDDPVCCESTCEILNDMGMNSEWVLTGRAAVERVRTRHEQGRDFFAIIIDWKLPGMDGVETCRQVRAVVGDEIPIVVFSAYDWSQIEHEAREAGVSAFVSKPLFRTKLASLFDSLMNKGDEEDLEAPLRRLEEMGLDGKCVLLVEDQEINAEIATDFLEMAGLEVEWAHDGQMATEMFAASPEGHYSMVFMDIQMPNMNGYEATEAIRAMRSSYARDVPIVAMTANAFADDVQRAKRAGMNAHIPKPIDVEALVQALETYVR